MIHGLTFEKPIQYAMVMKIAEHVDFNTKVDCREEYILWHKEDVNGLFIGQVSAAVAMSGSILTKGIVSRDGLTNAGFLAAGLGCATTKNSAEIVRCLKTQSTAQLLNGSLDVHDREPGSIYNYSKTTEFLVLPVCHIVIQSNVIDLLCSMCVDWYAVYASNRWQTHPQSTSSNPPSKTGWITVNWANRKLHLGIPPWRRCFLLTMWVFLISISSEQKFPQICACYVT